MIASRKHQARDVRKSNSWDLAIRAKILGKTYLLTKKVVANKRIAFTRIDDDSCKTATEVPDEFIPEIIVSKNIATKSCTRRIPTRSLPCRLSKSFLFERRVTIIAVEEKVSAIAKYAAEVVL